MVTTKQSGRAKKKAARAKKKRAKVTGGSKARTESAIAKDMLLMKFGDLEFTRDGYAKLGSVFDETLGQFLDTKNGMRLVVWTRPDVTGDLFRQFITSAAESVARRLARMPAHAFTAADVHDAAVYVFKRYKRQGCAADVLGGGTKGTGTFDGAVCTDVLNNSV